MNSRFRRPSPLSQFMVLSAAILLVGGGFLAWWMDRTIVQVVTDDSVTMAGVFVDSTIAPHLAELPSLAAMSPSQEAHLTQLMRNNVASGLYVAINVWSAEGELAFTTLDEPEVGPTQREWVAMALTGSVNTHRTDRVHGTPAAGEPATGNFLESYFRVQAPFTGEPLGVVSFTQDLSDLQRSVLYVRLLTWLVVGTATVLMYFLLYGIVSQWNDTIARQQAALDRSRRQIQQAAVRAAALNEASMRRLGADLHDGPAQDLGIALMRIEPLRAAIESHAGAKGQQPMDVEAAAFDLHLIHSALKSSLQEIRNMASGLRLPELADLDVAQTIQKATRDYMAKTGRTATTVEGPPTLAGADAVKSAAYRVVQEALNNGYQHGNPTQQSVRYSAEGGVLHLGISDDGCGFDPNATDSVGARRHLGLAGLQERSEIVGGRFEVQSAPGKGTVVRALLPLDPISDEDGSSPDLSLPISQGAGEET